MSNNLAPFDQIAGDYDALFSHSPAGKLIRQQVHVLLEPILHHNSMNILELNCGTGIDAVWLASKGHRVLATDISTSMVANTAARATVSPFSDHLTTQCLSINDLNQITTDHIFDLIFSNFGGFNCLSPHEILESTIHIHRLLRPGGDFVAVVMNDFCLWESLYFILKLKFKQIFRRKKISGHPVSIGNQAVINTWYYNRDNFKKLFAGRFNCIGTYPVGLFIPPPYILNQPHWEKYLQLLAKVDKKVQKFQFFSSFSDHFLIQLKTL